MRLDVEFEERAGYLFVKTSGRFSLVPAQGALLEMIRRSANLRLPAIVVDITGVSGLEQDTSAITRFYLANFANKTLPRGTRLALIATPRQVPATSREKEALPRLISVARVVPDLEQALDWLGIAHPKTSPSTNRQPKEKTKQGAKKP